MTAVQVALRVVLALIRHPVARAAGKAAAAAALNQIVRAMRTGAGSKKLPL